jgi:hypothetical protein
MKTNNPSNKTWKKGVDEGTNESKNLNDPSNKDNTGKMQNASQNTGMGNSSDYRGKGTGTSSEAGSAQSEQSWQGPGGSQGGTENYSGQSSKGSDMSNTGTLNMSSGSGQSGYTGTGNQGVADNMSTPKMDAEKEDNENIKKAGTNKNWNQNSSNK